MAIKERRDKEKLELKKKILNAAEELFAEAGYQNISMRKISDKIEYSLPTIYQFFKNKADILCHIVRVNNGVLLAIFIQINEKENNPIEKLKDMSRAYIKFALENPNYYELAYMSNAIKYEDDLDYNEPDSPGFKIYELILSTIIECKEQGYYKGKDTEIIGQCLWAGLHGLTSLFIGHTEFHWKRKNLLIENMITSLINE